MSEIVFDLRILFLEIKIYESYIKMLFFVFLTRYCSDTLNPVTFVVTFFTLRYFTFCAAMYVRH
jgi:hypothetical protein